MKKMIEGSRAVAEAVALCRPDVISAYPITPQTHIVEELSQIVADGQLDAEYIRVESEHSAASACLITGVNRALSAPLSIWNDHQDTMGIRDTGWLQLYAENNQEALDMHIQAYKIAEDDRVLLPVMVCMDGFILTHTYESVDMPEQEQVDAFLPKYDPLYRLDPEDPYTLGAYIGPELFHEARYVMQQDCLASKEVVKEVAREFKEAFGRWGGDVIEAYRCDDAETIVIGLGSVVGTLKDWADARRAEGQKVGALKLRCFRPFPGEELVEAVSGAKQVVVLEKAVGMGAQGIVASELRSALYGRSTVPVSCAIVGLGGRDVTFNTIDEACKRAGAGEREFFAGLRTEALEEA